MKLKMIEKYKDPSILQAMIFMVVTLAFAFYLVAKAQFLPITINNLMIYVLASVSFFSSLLFGLYSLKAFEYKRKRNSQNNKKSEGGKNE